MDRPLFMVRLVNRKVGEIGISPPTTEEDQARDFFREVRVFCKRGTIVALIKATTGVFDVDVIEEYKV